MKIQDKKERLLSFHYPKIEKHPNLPLNYQFISHYSKTEVDENGHTISTGFDTHKAIKMEKLQTTLNEFYGYYKPISRIFEDKININDE